MLSYGEKLTLWMMCDLMDGLGVNSDVDRGKIREAIQSGNTWSLSSTVLQDIAEPSDQIVKETFDILSMWRVIERDIDRLSEDDQKALIEEVGFGRKPRFEGFDGNNDPHFGVATHIIDEMGRFEEFRGRDLNSHTMSTLPRYRKFLEKYDSISRHHSGPFGPEELMKICDIRS